jgi:hypothetical protein
MLTSSQAHTGAIEAPAREQVNHRSCLQLAQEIGIGAATLKTLVDRAIETFDMEDHDALTFAHSVDLLAKDIERRADIVANFLDHQDIRGEAARGPDGAGEHFEEVKDRVRQCIQAWKAASSAGSIERERELNAEVKEAEAQIYDGGLNPSCPAFAMAKLIVAKGVEINRELKLEARDARLEAEAAAAALEWFRLRELYDGYFPGKEAVS